MLLRLIMRALAKPVNMRTLTWLVAAYVVDGLGIIKIINLGHALEAVIFTV